MQDGTAFTVDTKLSLEQEKQGIARAWRAGQTKQVQVVCAHVHFQVRFLTRDSIEEELAGKRGYKEGIVKNLDDDYVKITVI